MAMRIDIEFGKPLSRDQRIRLTLAIAAMAKSERIRFEDGNYRAVVMGENMGTQRMFQAVQEAGLEGADIRTSLHEEDDAKADDLGYVSEQQQAAVSRADVSAQERLRPIGR